MNNYINYYIYHIQSRIGVRPIVDKRGKYINKISLTVYSLHITNAQ